MLFDCDSLRQLASIQDALVYLLDYLYLGEVLPYLFSHLLPLWVGLVFKDNRVAHCLVEGLSGLVEQLKELIVVFIHLPTYLFLNLLQLFMQFVFLLGESNLLQHIGSFGFQSIPFNDLYPVDCVQCHWLLSSS
jgi:hypothetical protein